MMENKENIRCIIVDDQLFAMGILKNHLRHFPEITLAYAGTNIYEALHIIETTAIDLVFLDIQMPTMSGLEFMKRCQNRCKFIFTTAYPKYAIDGYEHDIIDFLLKPITLDRFKKSIVKFHQLNKLADQENSLLETGHILIKGDAKQKYFKVKLQDIYYAKGLDNYIRIYTRAGSIITYMNLKDLIGQLPADSFCRIHRSYIVSLQHITYVEKSLVKVSADTIPIGSSYRKQFFQVFQKSPMSRNT
ncbi:DNA-binding response regulator [Sphingobacterium puteale]|uniref:DNA-binding response regulator n=1 Tax=Sphingobacterium puteale TaxID=2420510 RepID=A0A420VWH8_9SPHI|nr:LytTR family DNA-binding domain-containing protein [Sphingobacterium puteale]RKO70701.1 DNA-binding response regulator [Sphingobacterium puteale]